MLLQPKERRQLGWFILLDIILILADIGFLVILLFIIHFYTSPVPASKLADFATSLPDNHSLLLIVAFFICFSLKNTWAYYIHRHRYRFLYSIASRIAENNLVQYLEGNYTGYVNIDSAIQIRKISQQPIEFSHYVLAGLLQIITQSIMIIIATAAILCYNPGLFLLLLICLVPPVILVASLIKKKTRAARAEAKKSSENTLQYLKEALAGFVEANIYEKRSFFVQRYAEWQQQLNQYLSDIQSIQGMPNRMIEIFAVAGLFILIGINKFSGNAAHTFINIGAFMAAAYKIMPAAVQVLNNNGQVRAYAFAVQDLLLYQSPEHKSLLKEKINIQSISFQQVCFSYGGPQLLSDFTASFKRGDFIGVEGRSGKGKTTLVHLLLGFLQEQSGQLLINGIPTKAASRQQFWPGIAYVKQQPFLVHGSIETNITLSDDAADQQRLHEVAGITGLDEISGNNSMGLKNIITENGKNISGGQRQRIMIARALYKDADLIILDEPFNELDRISENKLLQHFQQLAHSGRIVVLITHNRESLSFCNKIISPDEK